MVDKEKLLEIIEAGLQYEDSWFEILVDEK